MDFFRFSLKFVCEKSTSEANSTQIQQINDPTESRRNKIQNSVISFVWMMKKQMAYNEQSLDEIMKSRYSNSVRNTVKVRKRYHLYHITNDKNEAIFFFLPIFISRTFVHCEYCNSE